MAPFTLIKPDFTQIPLVKAGLSGIESGEQRVDLLTGDTVTLKVKSVSPINFGIGDSISVYGQLYTLNKIAPVTKDGDRRYIYDLVLEGPQYHLIRPIYFDTSTTGVSLASSFSLTGNLALFAQVLITNMARVFGGAWGLGDVYGTALGESGWIAGNQTETKTLSFDNETCLGVLQRLCTEFNTEFVIDYLPGQAPNRLLHIKPAGNVKPWVFKYGYGNALYQLVRRPVDQTQHYTRIYVFGAQKNLPYGYRGFSDRLQLPLPVGSPPPEHPKPLDSYVQNQQAISTYGLIEDTKIFEEIYPSRTGTVTIPYGNLGFIDSTIDFNPFQIEGTKKVNGQTVPNYKYLIPGLTPKINFTSGGLMGYTFDLTEFHTANKSLFFKAFKNEQGWEFPSSAPDSPFQVRAGDTYVLIDIRLPDEYVEAAEAKLLAAGQAYLDENSTPRAEYQLTIDQIYLRKLAGDTGPIPADVPSIFFAVGDQLRIVDADLAIDRFVRILSFVRNVLDPYEYALTLGDVRRVSLVDKILRTQAKVNRTLDNAGLSDTTPSVVPPAEATSKEDLIDLVKKGLGALGGVLGGGRLTASTGLPPGYVELKSGTPVRNQLEVGVVEKTDQLEQILGRVKAIGVRRLPDILSQ
ncbi:hypothetical protein GCM10027592_29740 [Spirosoma flavus]